jgi:hypothetical protein
MESHLKPRYPRRQSAPLLTPPDALSASCGVAQLAEDRAEQRNLARAPFAAESRVALGHPLITCHLSLVTAASLHITTHSRSTTPFLIGATAIRNRGNSHKTNDDSQF